MVNFINVVYSTQFDDDYNNKFDVMISNTIGCKHRIIRYINKNTHSLTELYNKALNDYKSNNTIFVFIHNDIVFKTRNWGKIILDKFNTTNFDIIGLAGTKIINNDGVWWADKNKLYGIVEHTDNIKTWSSSFSDEIDGIEDVVAIDGVFMAVNPNSILSTFDEKYDGFHFYDIPFCVENYLRGCDIGVITSIRILHKSIGEVNEKWDNARKKFVEEYNEEFPIKTEYEILGLKDYNVVTDGWSEPIFEPISIVIPTKNNFDYLYRCVESFADKTKYPNYEIVIADTGSDNETKDKYQDLFNLDVKIRIIYYNYYNFAKINNDVVMNHVNNNMIIFCNDDVVLLNDCVSLTMNVYKTNKNVGTVGIRLHYGDNSVQHNGIVMLFDENKNLLLGHKDIGKVSQYVTHGIKQINGSTAAFLLISKEVFLKYGMFSENYEECFEDVQLTIDILYDGQYKNYIVHHAVAYHYESISRRKNNEMGMRMKNELMKLEKYVKDKYIIKT